MVSAIVSAADVKVGPSDGSVKTVFLNGEIRTGDLAKVETAFARLPKSAPKDEFSPMNRLMVITSPGGDVREAMAIGRWIRQKRMAVVIPEAAQCFSSCVYLLAAGLVKMSHGEVGIHRPYFLSTPRQGVEPTIRKTLAESQSYFSEMNIPPQLADDMFSIPPERIEVLGRSGLARYRLNQDDMAFSEERDIRNANYFGMTRQEYMTNWRLYEKDSEKCRNLADSEFISCLTNARAKYGLLPKGQAN